MTQIFLLLSEHYNIYEVYIQRTVKVMVFCYVMLCSLADRSEHFRGSCLPDYMASHLRTPSS